MSMVKEEKLTLEDLVAAVRDKALTPRQQQRKAATYVGIPVDWVLSFFDVSELSTGKESLMFKHPDMFYERVFALADPHPEIENTHRGTLIRIKGVIMGVDALGVRLHADEVVFDIDTQGR